MAPPTAPAPQAILNQEGRAASEQVLKNADHTQPATVNQIQPSTHDNNDPPNTTQPAPRVPRQSDPTIKELIHEHRATTERLRAQAMDIQRYTEGIEEAMGRGMRQQDARIPYLITRVVIDKDRQALRSLEASLGRTLHSLWKLHRELHLQASGTDNHGMYELLEGFVAALAKSRGADREAWGVDGKELGAMLDQMKADIEWWDAPDDDDE
ncbi:hypothetical protein MPH_00323 [Macrophomina phaseolina MS6]|uniref:Uncharacterized protein n=1 Tax=Macrophomina phaseolina (strain MS6) TaxID=1126212 RepID=K2S5X3_MACPH|nr:hypothetical protein MPH_00323 [Macrophomina phaseolina MS6]